VSRQRSDVVVRLAEPDEARVVAEIHVRGWHWGYRDQIPREILGDLSVEQREAWWREAIEQHRDYRLWVADRDGRILGFAGTQPSEDEDATPDMAEIAAIYLEQDAAGTGVGRALTEHALADFRARGFRTAIWWVLETNDRTRRFLDRGGWRPDGATKAEDLRGFELREVRYSIRLR
jgi:L-amino acid N-acyltransferase YncA